MNVSPMSVTPALMGDQVYEVIERAIFTGRLSAGTPLRVRELAAMTGTSVQPVRDAIRRLEEAGLAAHTPHKSSTVREFTIVELLSVYRVRMLLETEGARAGTEQITPVDVDRMCAALKKMQKAVGEHRVVDALDADEELLRILYVAGRNPVVVTMIDTLWKQCRRYKVLGATAAFETGDASLWEPQPRILAAAATGDVAMAVEATEQSLLGARRRLEDRLGA